MKKIIVSTIITLACLIVYTNSYAMTISEIMSPKFGLREDVISIYDELTIKSGANKNDELRLSEDWMKILIKKIESSQLTQEEAIKLGKELLSVSMVGMFYSNKYFYGNQKEFDGYANRFMGPFYYSTYVLGVSQDLTDEVRNEINEKIYMPLLKVLAVRDKEVMQKLKKIINK